MFKFKKIASVLASTAMLSSTIALAAATTYPAPFVQNGVADVAIVYGSHTAATVDLVGVLKIQDSLNSYLTGATTSSTGSTVTGGDYVLLAISSDNLNLNDNWGVFTGAIDDEDLTTVLADGTYVADDNDEFDYEQSITIGTPTLQFFRDSDYEELVGLDERTPTIGFKISSNTWIMNYTLDFTTDAESDITSGDLEDIEGSDIRLMGKNYYVSDLKNGTSSTFLGKLTLLDSANTAIVNEGETVTVTVGDKSYDVSIVSLSTTEAKLSINGETTDGLAEGAAYKLSDGTYVGIKDIFQRDVSGVTGNVEFSLGSGKLEITSGSDIKLNDDTVQGVRGYVHRGTGSSGSEKIDKIVIEWISDEELFLTPEHDLVLPGFETLKFTMNDLIRPEEEKVVIEKDSDNSMAISVPIKDGTVSFNLLYNDASSGNITGIGKASDERLATSATNTLTFYEKHGGNDMDSWFVASYNISTQAESYLLRAKISYDSSANRNETTIEKNTGSAWEEVCGDRKEGDDCKIGLVSFTINDINYTSGGDELITITAGSNVNFNTIYTTGGLKIWLPVNTSITGSQAAYGSINLTSGVNTSPIAGHDVNYWWLFMQEEDKDDNIASGNMFNFTIDDTTASNHPLQVSQVNGAGSGGPASSKAYAGLEKGDSTSIYETYMKSDVATRILHYTKSDEDYAEVYYPTGDSETYAEVFLAEVGASISGGGSTTGTSTTVGVPILDTEVSSAAGKNLIVVGGSCVNSVAADLLGSSTPLCGSDWEAKTGVGAGEYLIQTFERTGGKVATLVAGYNAGDTQNAAQALVTQTIETTAGKKYTGTTATSVTAVTTEA